jgi:hypothetical protein
MGHGFPFLKPRETHRTISENKKKQAEPGRKRRRRNMQGLQSLSSPLTTTQNPRLRLVPSLFFQSSTKRTAFSPNIWAKKLSVKCEYFQQQRLTTTTAPNNSFSSQTPGGGSTTVLHLFFLFFFLIIIFSPG